jgi:DNA-binding transcriptional ArsR family regulator
VESKRQAWRESIRDSNLPRTTKHVALVLSLRMNEDLVCWPSQLTIAHEAGLTDRAVRKHLKILRDGGWLSRRRTGRSDRYSGQSGTAFLSDRSQGPVRAEPRSAESVREPDKESDRESTTSVIRVRRKPRNPLFDAIAEWQGVPSGGTCPDALGSTIGVALSQIRVVCPTVTPEEIRFRISNIPPTWTTSGPMALAKHWHRLAGRTVSGAGSRLLREAHEEVMVNAASQSETPARHVVGSLPSA